MRRILRYLLWAMCLPVMLMMGVTPVHAAFTFRTRGGNLSVDAYVSDVANGLVTFDDGVGASATSNTFWMAPTNCILIDVAITTGPTVMGRLAIARNSIPTGNVLGIIPHVDTSPQRPPLAIPFPAGSKLTALQYAV